MSRWCLTRSVLAVVMLSPLWQLTVCESATQSVDGAMPQGYHERRPLQPPGTEFDQGGWSRTMPSPYLGRPVRSINSGHHKPDQNRTGTEHEQADSNARPDQIRRNMPRRLIPPGRERNSNGTDFLPDAANRAVVENDPSSLPIPFDDSNVGAGVRPSFPLPPIVQPPQVTGNKNPPPTSATMKGRSHASVPASGDRNSSVAFSKSVHATRSLSSASTMPAAGKATKRDQMVTRASIVIAGTASQATATQVNSPIASRAARYPDDPFQDPAPDDASPRPNPFADPPPDLLPQNRQQDPFADPPEDMDPARVQDPFGDPVQEPGDETTADPSVEIKPSTELQMPDTGPPTDESSVLEVDEPLASEPLIQPPRQILGPFEQPGYQPSPLLEAPEYREFEQYAQPLPTVPAPAAAYERGLLRAPDEWQYPVNPNPVQTPPGQSYLDQPTLSATGTTGFEKRDLYRGLAHDVEGNDYPAYECSTCHAGLPGQGRAGRMSACPTGVDGCGPGGGQYFECCCEPMFYVSIFGGYTGLQDSSPLFLPGTDFQASGSVNYNDGFGVGLAVGQVQGENLRTELEFSYRYNGTDSLQAQSQILPLDGSVESYAGMFNLYWDFRPQPALACIRPYLGGGVGFAFVESKVSNRSVPVVNEDYRSDSSFAWQLMGGFSRQLNYHIDGFVEYRYFSAESIRLNLDAPIAALGNVGYDTNNIFFGFRTRF